jgi:hypothetical protein
VVFDLTDRSLTEILILNYGTIVSSCNANSLLDGANEK